MVEGDLGISVMPLKVGSVIFESGSSLDTLENDEECLSVDLLVTKCIMSVGPDWVLDSRLVTVAIETTSEGKVPSMALESFTGDKIVCGVVTLFLFGCLVESISGLVGLGLYGLLYVNGMVALGWLLLNVDAGELDFSSRLN